MSLAWWALLIKVGFCDVLVWSLNTNEVREVAAMANFNLNKTQSLNGALRAVYMEEERGISWPLVEGSENNHISCFPTHTDSKNSLYLCISKLHGPGPIKRWCSTYNSLWTKFMKWHLVYFVQGFMHSLWWLQSPEIITCNSVLVPLGHSIISMLVLAPMFILLQARPFICKQN